LRIIYIGS